MIQICCNAPINTLISGRRRKSALSEVSIKRSFLNAHHVAVRFTTRVIHIERVLFSRDHRTPHFAHLSCDIVKTHRLAVLHRHASRTANHQLRPRCGRGHGPLPKSAIPQDRRGDAEQFDRVRPYTDGSHEHPREEHRERRRGARGAEPGAEAILELLSVYGRVREEYRRHRSDEGIGVSHESKLPEVRQSVN